MNTVKELREYCEILRFNREEELKNILNDYFNIVFIKSHKPWRAVIGNKRCMPIPIHCDFCSINDKSTYSRKRDWGWKFNWPNMSEELIRKQLVSLGFVVTENQICISVPYYENGKNLTFAQEWVKKINYSYSQYCADEKKKAMEIYKELLAKLMLLPSENILTFEKYTLFSEIKLERSVSNECNKHLKKFMANDGIEEYYEEGVYKGIIVLSDTSN